MSTQVGERVANPEALDALPVGAAVTVKGSKKLMTKHPDGWAQHRDQKARHDAAVVWWDGMEVVSLPYAFYAGPQPGDRIDTTEKAAALPIGSVIANTNSPDQRWQKGDANGYYDPNHHAWSGIYQGTTLNERAFGDYLATRPFVVESVPEDLGETVEQFGWRFRDLALTGAERALGSWEYAEPVLTPLGLDFRPSVGLRIVNHHDRSRLPRDTYVTVGNPDDWSTFSVWHNDANRGWRRVFGRGDIGPRNALAVVIDRLPDTTEPEAWLTARPTEEDRAKIIQFRAKAWKAGVREKRKRRWCSEFERVMLRGGISEDSLSQPMLGGFRIGNVVTPEQAATLPVGVLLSTPVETGHGVAIFERTEKSTNRAGTRRIAGWNFNHHLAPRMTIIGLRDDDMLGLGLRCTSVGLMESVPVGTVIGSETENLYVKLAATGRAWNRLFGFGTDNEYAEYAAESGVGRHRNEDFSPGPRCGFWFYRFGPTVPVNEEVGA